MKLNKELAKLYYSASEARKALGLDEEEFQYWGRTERIKRIYLPGRKHPVYSKQEINRMANQIEAALLAEQVEGIEFRKATSDDIEQESQLAALVFGENARLYEERKAFLQKNPEIDYHVYDLDRLVAYLTIIPLKHSTIESYVGGQIKNIYKIDIDDIEQFIPGKPLECILVDMITTPTVPPRQRGTYGAKLLSGLAREFARMGKQGVEITKLYATSRTPSGIRILKNAGFTVIQHDPKNNRYSFELDIMSSNEKLLRDYKEALRQCQEKAKTS